MLTGLRHTVDFFRGAHDQGMDMSNPFKIYEGLHQFGQDEADIYLPSADGTTKDGDAFARKMGHDALDGFNPFDKPSAYETGKAGTNIVSVLLPGAEELTALRGLKLAETAADEGEVVARAAAQKAAGTPGQAAADEALRTAEARQAAAHEAYQAKLPGAGVRKVADKAKAAGRRLKDRQAGGAEPSVRTPASQTPEQVAAAEQKFNAQKQGALEEARHQQLHRRRPALAGGHSAGVARPSEAPSGPSTKAIGQPGGKSGVMKMAGAERGGEATTKATDAQIKKVTEETKKQAAEAVAISKANKDAKKPQPAPGPCQNGTLDLKTGKFYPQRNTNLAPEKVHPVFKKRLVDHKARTGGLTPERAGVLEDEYANGMHAEVGGLNDAFLDREAMGLEPVTEEDMNEFLLHNVQLKGPGRGEAPMPRCFNCFHLTQGVQVTPELGVAELDFYNKEYGPDFMDNVASLYPNVGQGKMPEK